ncbi:hypothetical protein H310_06894 [Aphanomyces invadans]|uniref:Calmodulin-lysine N-methyltransferase n=1 Tax=Aphanomyces invadans TaxID=157072 RepID=A0A024U6V0_9STRA|nr:hypothetical protein H310_06894 [Aphanomyces invadans]ETW01333.1 hypothetical protein H310_06894 [Aphanomyces invadans]|eukprot:XP_008870331.1 hypothetical protein H310_06894 [Aphanomyces invadans]
MNQDMSADPPPAKARWARLRAAIRKHVDDSSSSASQLPSAMSMFAFHPVESLVLPDLAPRRSDYEWRRYPLPQPPYHLSLHTRKPDGNISIHELAIQDVDNTGNIRTWPCEDLLWRILLAKFEQYHGPPLRFLELGAGMCGIAGLALGSQLPASTLSSIVLTDGNTSCVDNLHVNLDVNVAHGNLRPHIATAELLTWSRTMPPVVDPARQFDVVIASDCLFFESFHLDLVHTLRHVTKPCSDTAIYLLQPSRGGSLDRFVALAKDFFHVTVETDFDNDVTAKHAAFALDRQYIPSLHQPILVTLRWPPHAV